MSNIMEVKFSAKSENESLARVIAASFAAKLDPTLDEIADIKTAVSEAVTMLLSMVTMKMNQSLYI